MYLRKSGILCSIHQQKKKKNLNTVRVIIKQKKSVHFRKSCPCHHFNSLSNITTKIPIGVT